MPSANADKDKAYPVLFRPNGPFARMHRRRRTVQIRGGFGNERSTRRPRAAGKPPVRADQRDPGGQAGTEGGANQVAAVDADLAQRVEHVTDRGSARHSDVSQTHDSTKVEACRPVNPST